MEKRFTNKLDPAPRVKIDTCNNIISHIIVRGPWMKFMANNIVRKYAQAIGRVQFFGRVPLLFSMPNFFLRTSHHFASIL